MRTRRVSQVAKELGIGSRELIAWLHAHGEYVKTASSVLHPRVEAELVASSAAAIAAFASEYAAEHPRPLPPPLLDPWWFDEDEYGFLNEPIWVGPSLLSTSEAARAVTVVPATIRQWVLRGHLAPVGKKRGRSQVFRAVDVIQTSKATRERVRKPAQSSRQRRPSGVDRQRATTSANINDLVTAAEAAYSAGVATSTVRSWAHRGLLRPAGRAGQANLFIRSDAIKLARRAPYRPPRKPRSS